MFAIDIYFEYVSLKKIINYIIVKLLAYKSVEYYFAGTQNPSNAGNNYTPRRIPVYAIYVFLDCLFEV